jgi:hypothetical protein
VRYTQGTVASAPGRSRSSQGPCLEALRRCQPERQAAQPCGRLARLRGGDRAAHGEAVGLAFYQGWKRAEAAGLFEFSGRTARRRRHSALLRPNGFLHGKDA